MAWEGDFDLLMDLSYFSVKVAVGAFVSGSSQVTITANYYSTAKTSTFIITAFMSCLMAISSWYSIRSLN